MRSLKTETPRVSLPVRTPAQKSTPPTASPGIVPPASTAPKSDGFEPSGSSSGTKASLAYIGASGTKPNGGELSSAVMAQLDQAARVIVAKAPDMNRGQINQAIRDAVDALGLQSKREVHAARRYLRTEVYSCLESGSGGSGNKHFGAELLAAPRPSDGTSFTPSTGGSKSTAPSTGTRRKPEPHWRVLSNVARKLAGDANLQTDAHVRKAAWAEIKKLGLSEAANQEARSFVLEQFAALRRGVR